MLRLRFARFARAFATKASAQFRYTPLFQTQGKPTEYRLLTRDGVSLKDGRLRVERSVLVDLAQKAMADASYLLRPTQLESWRKMVEDPNASDNDKFVCMEMMKNAVISAERVLPLCQDTGTAQVLAYRGQDVWTPGGDEAALWEGIWRHYTGAFMRYSQTAALDMFEEANTGNNLPAQVDINATDGNEYKFMFMAKGGGSANKTNLYQQTKALLNPKSLFAFLKEKVRDLGTAACPPYHIGVTIGGLSADQTLKTAKLASTRYYDDLVTTGDKTGRAFRDVEWEEKMLKFTRDELGIGAQFGGKYFAHSFRIIRLPRHGASCPVGIAVSCSADRQILAKITPEGVFLEKLESDPARHLPEEAKQEHSKEAQKPDSDAAPGHVSVNLSRPMSEIRKQLGGLSVSQLLLLNGPIIVARDIAHAKIQERLDSGEGMPQYMKDHMVYYAGPAKQPPTETSGSFGPTTAGRMDSYVGPFMKAGGSFVTLAKGNRSQQVTDACKKYGGFYLGSVGGPAAILARNCIKSVECVEYPELGMEAVWKIEVENFPAVLLVDDRGNDFYSEWF